MIFLPLHMCDAWRDLVPIVQFKKREKHPEKNVTSSKVTFLLNVTKSNIPPWVFFTFFKLYKYQFAQSITYIYSSTNEIWGQSTKKLLYFFWKT